MNLNISFLFLIAFLAITFSAQAQLNQTIRGKVVDSESQFPLEGVTISLLTLKA